MIKKSKITNNEKAYKLALDSREKNRKEFFDCKPDFNGIYQQIENSAKQGLFYVKIYYAFGPLKYFPFVCEELVGNGFDVGNLDSKNEYFEISWND